MAQSTSRRVQSVEQEESTQSAKTKPVDKFTDGPVHVSIWEKNGPKGAFRTASFELRYKDGEEWKSGYSYNATGLKHLESAAREAHSRIETWQQTSALSPAPSR